MANVVYPKARERALGTGLNLMAADVRALLVDLDEYTYDAAHEFLSDVPAGAQVSHSGLLANKSLAGGVFDSDNASFPSVTGNASEALILYVDTGDPATSYLVTYLDTNVTGLPITPDGRNILIGVNENGWIRI
ncbi:hypothetical protein AB1L88_15695 [Tautonia sp. JC769]|uniref:hypothetical protein n=1 Tax=Tautonia sp. JC769 TaxID=3232135 RepID=UPI00345ACF1C